MSSLRSAAPVVGLTVLTSIAFGCDDGRAVPFREHKCNEICARYEMCNDETDLTDCQSACSAESFRSDVFFDMKAQCVNGLSCNRLEERDESAALADCIRDDLRDKQLSSSMWEMCRDLANKLAACVSTVDPSALQESCESIAVTLSSEYVVASQDCTQLRCAEISSCLSELADAYDTNVKVYSGKSTD